MNFIDVLCNRRSVRKYTSEPVADEKIKAIIQAGLLSASSRNKRPWRLILVKDKQKLQALSECRTGSAKMLAGAYCAIVVIADESLADVWTEDCSIVMSNMHLMADSLGVGSCWIQGRLREKNEEQTTEDAVREILKFPENFRLEAMLSVGMPESHNPPCTLEELHYEKVYAEEFGKKAEL